MDLERRDWTLEIETGALRGDPSNYLFDLFLNGRVLENVVIDRKTGMISALLPAGLFLQGKPQCLSLTARPLPVEFRGEGDDRALGVPLCELRFR
jgi:hypothetical protein